MFSGTNSGSDGISKLVEDRETVVFLGNRALPPTKGIGSYRATHRCCPSGVHLVSSGAWRRNKELEKEKLQVGEVDGDKLPASATETCVEYTQESSVEQRSPDDFDYDDITIDKTLLDACRRHVDHSEEEGLSFSLSSSVSHSSVQEIQRHSSESEQIRILLERQREQILADCRAEIQKHEFQADYDRRSIQKLNGVVGSQRGEMNRALGGDEQLRRDQQLLHEQLWELKSRTS